MLLPEQRIVCLLICVPDDSASQTMGLEHCGINFATDTAVFENTDENKLEYTRIFESYTKMIESFVMESLTAQLPGFAMDEFLGMLQAREVSWMETFSSSSTHWETFRFSKT